MTKIEFSSEGSFEGLAAKLEHLAKELPNAASSWARDSAADTARHWRHNLETQGRGGAPPPLSPMTLEIYKQVGDPDGSGIRNHIRIDKRSLSQGVEYLAGILEGQPTLVAHVQNDGAAIPVTPKMRAYFAARFKIFIRKDIIFVPGRGFLDRADAVVRPRSRQLLQRKIKSLWDGVDAGSLQL